MLSMDEAHEVAKNIYEQAKENIDNIVSEEDAKIQIITRIFSECLGWSFKDFHAENHHENGYSDYILSEENQAVLLIEAKRIGKIEIDTSERNKVRHLKISGSGLKKSIDGINQAASYASPNGISIAVLTDGLSWIVFKPFISGTNFKEKEAIVFPSIDSVLYDFSKFFELLSKNSYRKKLFNSIFDEIHQKRLLITQDLIPAIQEKDIRLNKKTDIAFDLDKVFSSFFSRLSGDEDEDLLIECFVETRESRIADFSLEKMTKNVLGNISPSEKNVDSELATLIKDSVDIEIPQSESGQTIFIVGPTGAGKTTFLDRFFRKTLQKELRKKCVVIKVNCLDATGSEDTALSWMTETIINELEKEVYREGIPNWEELCGLYHLDYKRRLKGVDSQLYKRDKAAFKEKFGQYLDQKVEEDREGYLKRVLQDVVKNRKKLPIFLIDNIDEFTPEYKEKVFQFTQALRRNANHCLAIFPVTDKSAWSFSKTDIYGIYKSKSFFLPTPSPREVFRKRINFLSQKVSDSDENKKNRHEYLSQRGIRISIEDLRGFAQVLERVFVDNDYTSKTIGELTNYNIRRTLLLSQRVITSPVIKIEDLIRSFVGNEFVVPGFTIFMEALMKGDYELYKHNDNHEIYPIFQVDSEIKQSPLLQLRILYLLDSVDKGGREIEEKHLRVQSIIDYFDAIGCSETSVDKAILSLLESGLIEPYDESIRDISTGQKLAISHRGRSHLRLASNNSVFFFQMALTTSITDADVALKMKSLYKNNDLSFQQKIEQIRALFLDYLILEDQQFVVSNELAQYKCQSDLLENLNKFKSKHDHEDTDLVNTLGDEYKTGVIKKGILATVDFYDSEKGFGFADVDEIDTRVYFHAEKLNEFEIKSLNDGDGILCDIARNDKGVHIDKIHDIEVHNNKTENVECNIIRIFHERNYGFVKVQKSNRDAFFHMSIFPEEERKKLTVGQSLNVEIISDKKGCGYQVKRVL